jgi:putative ABC transport system permease protein
VFGAKRIQLNSQLLTSLGIETSCALFVSAYLVSVLTPLFSSFVFLDFRFGDLAGWLVVCLASGFLLTLLFGLFPVHYINALRVRVRGRNTTWRKIMVTVQLFIGVLFIFSIMVVSRQFAYLQNTDLGFDRKDIVHTYRPSSVDWPTFKATLDVNPDILLSTGLTTPLFTDQNQGPVDWEGQSGKDSMLIQMYIVDVNFLDFFSIGVQSGDFFSPEQSNANYTVINQTAARIMGLDNPTGHTINLGNGQKMQIIGVVNDFHILPLRQPIEPVMLICWGTRRSDVYVRINPVERQRALTYLQETYEKFAAPGDLFTYNFLDDEYASFNRSEQAMRSVFGIMAIVCLLISAFGIYSMASLSTLHRRKEIAIRKVMGAEAVDISVMFFREYLMLVLIANIVALPVANWLMNRWLQNYAYHVNIAWWMFVAVLALTLVIVLITVLGQVLKAANGNPAEVVKSE